MSYRIEEKLREAACLGHAEGVESLISQNVNINGQNRINGWTALHWACKRGHEGVVRLLMEHGADASIKTKSGERPIDVCLHSNISQILGEPCAIPPVEHNDNNGDTPAKFVPNYIKNAPLNGMVDVDVMQPTKQPSPLPLTNLPSVSTQPHTNVLVVKVRVNGSCDPDFIEIEVQNECCTYANLLETCCEELNVSASQVDRIRKLPDTRLRNDNDVRRLCDMQELEIVLKGPGLEKYNNTYLSISSCKDQTILY